MSLAVAVVPILDSRYVDTSQFDDVPCFFGKIDGEITPPFPPKCFLGAWYRKVFSSFDNWLGIEGVIELGEFTPDPMRFNLDGLGRSMDNPSVYMGGKAQEESDAGLGMNLTYLSNDTSQELDDSSPKLAYRPFWRYIYKDATDFSGNVTRREVNSWNISNPRSLKHYYFPGDILRMKIYSPIPNYLQLRIEVVSGTTISKYVELRKKYLLKNDMPSDFYSPIFYSSGCGHSPAEFKRVNSIDQFGNEGFNAKDTKATVSQAIWHETYLYRNVGGKLVKVPFDKNRQASMICPNKKAISVTLIDDLVGAESIMIHPAKIHSEE